MSEEVMKAPVMTKEPSNGEKVKKKKSLPRKVLEGVFYALFAVIFAVVIIGNISGEINKKDNFGQSIRFGYGSFIVLTTSMEPEIKKDSAIITHKDSVESVYKQFLEYSEYNAPIIEKENEKPEEERDFSKCKYIDITFANINTGTIIIPDTPEFKPINGGQLIVTNRIMTHRLREVHIDEEKEVGEGRYIFITSGINHQGEASLKGQYQVFTEKQYLGVVKVSNPVLGKIFNFIVSPIGLLILLLVPALYLIVTSTIDIFKAMKTAEDEQSAISSDSSGKLAGVSSKDRERLKKELLEEMARKRKERVDNENKD